MDKPETRRAISEAISEAGAKLGYELRDNQRVVVQNFVQGSDVFVSLPTGSGKSLCFSILPWTFDIIRKHKQPTCIIIVVSPLIALMKDQVASLEKKGLSAVYCGDAMSNNDKMAQVAEGKYQVIFISPELLLLEDTWREMLLSPVEHLVGLIVDEAHCVKKW